MLEVVGALRDEFQNLLNTSAFSKDSIEGWIIIILCLILVYEISQKAIKAVGWLIGAIFFFQVCYWLSLTSVNDTIPLSVIFKYDVLQAIAQCFVGTRLCDFLLWADAFMRVVCSKTWELLKGLDLHIPEMHLRDHFNVY